jgi:hypothetical protein
MCKILLNYKSNFHALRKTKRTNQNMLELIKKQWSSMNYDIELHVIFTTKL